MSSTEVLASDHNSGKRPLEITTRSTKLEIFVSVTDSIEHLKQNLWFTTTASLKNLLYAITTTTDNLK